MAARHAIGIDVGGTKIAGGLVELESGRILYRTEEPTLPSRGGAQALECTLAMAENLAAQARADGREVSAMGLGICEIVDNRGILRSASLLDWRDEASARMIAAAGLWLVSDVRAAALAEVSWGRAKGADHVLYVSIGTGIASALVIGGVPYAGAHGAALVLASATRLNGGTAVLEDIVSGAGLARQFGKADGNARPIFAAAQAGNARALAILSEAAGLLGAAVGQLANCVDPELIILGGGIGSLPGPYHDLLRARITANIWSGISRCPRIERAGLGHEGGIAGAALAALTRQH